VDAEKPRTIACVWNKMEEKRRTGGCKVKSLRSAWLATGPGSRIAKEKEKKKRKREEWKGAAWKETDSGVMKIHIVSHWLGTVST